MPSSPKSADAGHAIGRRLAREVALLVFLALLPAALSGWLHPRSAFRAPDDGGIPKVELAAVRNWSGPVLWVDARPAAAFAQAHVPGAVPLTERDWEQQLPGFMAQWQPGVRVLVYCDGAHCNASLGVAQRLKRELQLEQVHVLNGGWDAWQKNPRP